MEKEELQKKGEAILESAASLRESIRCQLELVAKLERQGHLYRFGLDPQKIKGTCMHAPGRRVRGAGGEMIDVGESKVTMENGDRHIVPTRWLFASDPYGKKH